MKHLTQISRVFFEKSFQTQKFHYFSESSMNFFPKKKYTLKQPRFRSTNIAIIRDVKRNETVGPLISMFRGKYSTVL